MHVSLKWMHLATIVGNLDSLGTQRVSLGIEIHVWMGGKALPVQESGSLTQDNAIGESKTTSSGSIF